LQAAGDLLQRARVRYPGDLIIQDALGAIVPAGTGDSTEQAARESIRLLTEQGAGASLLAAAHQALGDILVKRADQAGAVAAYRQAIRLVPDRTDYRKSLLEQLVLQRSAETLAASSDWIQSGPPHAYPYRIRSSEYKNRKQYSSALPDAVKATELAPEDPEAWRVRAEALRGLERLKDALACMDKAIVLAQRGGKVPAQYLLARGWDHRALNQVDEALADFGRAIEQEPTELNFLAARQSLYAARGEWDKALADCNTAMKFDVGASALNGLYWRAGLYHRMKRYQEAIADYTTLVNRYPDYSPYRVALISLLVNCPEKALRAPRRALELLAQTKPPLLFGGEVSYWQYAGVAHFQLKEWEPARAALTRVVDQRPDVSLFLALIHHELGDETEARRWYDRASTARTGRRVISSTLILEEEPRADLLFGRAKQVPAR
jgi:tetratricopeptide (TPR) repeat protein